MVQAWRQRGGTDSLSCVTPPPVRNSVARREARCALYERVSALRSAAGVALRSADQG